MNILFVAAEMTPFAKTGGLADVVGALPQELARRGHQVRVILPFYPSVITVKLPFHRLPHRLTVHLGQTICTLEVCEAVLDLVTVWFLDFPEFYARSGLYGTPDGDFPDNHQRFALLCLGALKLVKTVAFQPDIIHCHDWHAALLPALLAWEKRDTFFTLCKTVLTIHNLAFQGLFPLATVAELGFSANWLRIDRAEFYGQFSFLKAGLMTADRITTVSPTYRQETLMSASGCGLDGVLRSRGDAYVGILNGIDYTEWNPEADQRLPARYRAGDLAGKAHCKTALQRQLGLPVAPNLPLLAMVSRLTEQKGCDLLLQLMPRLAASTLQLVLLGTGEERYLSAFRTVAGKGYPNISLNLEFHQELGPLIYAGADLILMPSRFEPCGLGQLIALRYGAVPVVRRTGGLADTVQNSTLSKSGTGFLFDEYQAASFWQAIQLACAAYHKRMDWEKIVYRGMSADFSWGRSVIAYEELYLAVIDNTLEVYP